MLIYIEFGMKSLENVYRSIEKVINQRITSLNNLKIKSIPNLLKENNSQGSNFIFNIYRFDYLLIGVFIPLSLHVVYIFLQHCPVMLCPSFILLPSTILHIYFEWDIFTFGAKCTKFCVPIGMMAFWHLLHFIWLCFRWSTIMSMVSINFNTKKSMQSIIICAGNYIIIYQLKISYYCYVCRWNKC